MSISPKMDGKDEKKSTKGISFSGKTNYFEGDLKPKKLKDKKIKRIFNYCIKIKGYINEVEFMNSLMIKIVDNFENGFFVKAEKNKLKFII